MGHGVDLLFADDRVAARQLLEEVERLRRRGDGLGEQLAQELQQVTVQHTGQAGEVGRLDDLEELLQTPAAASEDAPDGLAGQAGLLAGERGV